jgi:hypothetical protein
MMGDGNPMKCSDVRTKASIAKLGERNPAKRPDVRKKISSAQFALGQNHPSKRPEVQIKRLATLAWNQLQKQPYWGA